MRLVWQGTDSLMLVDVSKRSTRKKIVWMFFRLLVRILDRYYAEGHYVDSPNLIDNLNRFGITKPVTVRPDPPKYGIVFAKEPHNAFNVLYYCPYPATKFQSWLYGLDIYEQIRKEFEGVCTFYRVTGYQDMTKIYPITDFYLRCNRHDGASRMVTECKINGIPYYHSQRNPDINEIRKQLTKAIQQKDSISPRPTA